MLPILVVVAGGEAEVDEVNLAELSFIYGLFLFNHLLVEVKWQVSD